MLCRLAFWETNFDPDSFATNERGDNVPKTVPGVIRHNNDQVPA